MIDKKREIAAVGELTAGDRLLLELYLEQESDRVWKLEQEKLLAAVEAGHTITAFRDFLIAKSDDEIPPIVEQFLTDLQERTQSLSPLDIGDDFGGSIRQPAHFCGIFGLKPTDRRVPTTGHIPELPGMPKCIRQMLTVGPLARSVEDLRLCLQPTLNHSLSPGIPLL